jgi:hypothetical protein
VAVPVKEWHNHEVHIQRHTSVMMDEEFDRLTITHPEIVRLFDEHIAMHQQVLQKRQQEQMQMMLAAKGAPEAPGAATNGGPPGAADQSGGGDQPQVAEMSQLTDVPDVIGRGVTRSTALRTNR